MKTNARRILTCLTALTMAVPQLPAFHVNAEPLPQKTKESVSAPAASAPEPAAPAVTTGPASAAAPATGTCTTAMAPAVTQYPATSTYGNMGTDHCCTTNDFWTTSTYTTWRTDQCSDLSYGFTTYEDYGESTTTMTTDVTCSCDDYVERLRHTFDPDKDHSKYEEGVISVDWGSVPEVYVGEDLDIAYILFNASGSYYNEGMETDINWDIFEGHVTDYDYEIDYANFDNTKPGTYELTLYVRLDQPDAYGGKCKFTVEVIEPEITTMTTACGYGSINFQTIPKTVYQIGEELDLDGIIITGAGSPRAGVYWDIFGQPLTDFTHKVDASEFDNTKPGKYKITVTVQVNSVGYTTLATNSFEVVVEESDPNVNWTENIYDNAPTPIAKDQVINAYPGYDFSIHLPYCAKNHTALMDTMIQLEDGTAPQHVSKGYFEFYSDTIVWRSTGLSEGTETISFLAKSKSSGIVSRYSFSLNVAEPTEPVVTTTRLLMTSIKPYDGTETENCENLTTYTIAYPVGVDGGGREYTVYDISVEQDSSISGNIMDAVWFSSDEIIVDDPSAVSKRVQQDPLIYTVSSLSGAVSKTFVLSVNGCKPAPIVDDVNGDGEFDIRDAVLLSRIVGGDTTVTVTNAMREQGDCNGNGLLDPADLTMLLKKLARLLT